MLAIIGGTGLYAMDGMKVIEEHKVETPFGTPSDVIIRVQFKGTELLFLPRHGRTHSMLPHEINYRANIYALKKLGARQVISISASGSLQEECKPGDLALASQYFDFIKGDRARTFFGDGLVAHISSAEAACPVLASAITSAANRLGYKIHGNKTYAAVDGPRLGTKAESFFLRDAAKADVVGMTNIPEVFLAREAQLAYITLAVVTDYDCWMDDPAQKATAELVIARYGESLSRVQALICQIIEQGVPRSDEEYRCALQGAIVTPPEARTAAHDALLDVLQA